MTRVATIALGVAAATLIGAADPPVGGEPVAPVQRIDRLDGGKIELGRELFEDVRLSHDDGFACASCHRLDAGGDDGRVYALGADGRPLDFNTPTVFNTANNFRLNWRGNFRSLEEQNEFVLLNPRIMNTTWQELLAKLQGEPRYAAAFVSLYGGAPTPARVLDALATFQRSLVTPNARFDRWLGGETTAMSEDEQRGYRLFKSYGCIACHQGANLGGNLFQRIGIFHDPFARPDLSDAAALGRFTITGLERDKRVFRVPSLRNVAVTAPYFHNGYTFSLAEAVEIMGRSQLGRELPKSDVDAIVMFLKTLTGDYRGRSLAGSDRDPQ